MKRYIVAAGALLLGTSALALAADTDMTKSPMAAKDMTTTTTATKTSDGSWATPLDKSLMAQKQSAKMAWSEAIPDQMSSASDAGKIAATGAADKLAMASAGEWTDKDLSGSGLDAKVQTASSDSWSSDMTNPKLAMASTAQGSAMQAEENGMGGPLEGTTMASTSLTPQPAVENYPPCEPGPGDDRCIQLYEPGVRAQLASWNRPNGGLAEGSATNAMGGPYELVASHAGASAASALNETSETELTDDQGVGGPAEQDVHLASHSAHQGVGGPVEAQSGYPPCSPGAGDDRCIQLYERGVTGAGN